MSAGNAESGKKEPIVANEVYNIIMTLSNKLQALAVYDEYQKDGQANKGIWNELRQQDDDAVRRLLPQLEQFAKDGKLRAR